MSGLAVSRPVSLLGALPLILLWASIAGPLATLPVAAISAAAVLAGPAPSQGGCLSKGKWYPEGAKVQPDPRSRLILPGYFECKRGKWVFVRD